MKRESLGTHQKALRINLDTAKYGTFAEIGAGQEVARWFFRVGAAAGTVAKTMSAYDMTFSDAIYGAVHRYVSRRRLVTMLDHEYGLLLERLGPNRGESTRFFAFADTVVARSYSRKEDAHGWMGIRFQDRPGAPPSQIVIHVRPWDKENIQQQEAFGILGVNLVFGALYLFNDPVDLTLSLVENLSIDRMEVDMIDFSGPAFEDVDNRLMSLILVQNGLTNAAMFTADGENVQPADELYRKCILVERGNFRPVTNVTLDMLDCARRQFEKEEKVTDQDIVELMEMTLRNLMSEGEINHRDFLDRVDILSALGKTVLISNYAEFHRLAAYLFRYTRQKIGIVMGVPTLRELFDEKYYADLAGGILESFGRMFKHDLKLYVYPLLDQANGQLVTLANHQVPSHLRHLYAYLMENDFMEDIRGFKREYLPIFSREVLRKLREGDSDWEHMVPAEVARIIKQRQLFRWEAGER